MEYREKVAVESNGNADTVGSQEGDENAEGGKAISCTLKNHLWGI